MHSGGPILPSKRKMVSYPHVLYYYMIPSLFSSETGTVIELETKCITFAIFNSICSLKSSVGLNMVDEK